MPNSYGELSVESAHLPSLTDDAIKGLLRSIGDAGATPTNAAGWTALNYLNYIYSNTTPVKSDAAKGLLRSIGDCGDTPANTTGFTVLKQLAELLLDTKVLNDDSIKGLLRTFGDAGTTPANATGNTVLKQLTEILADTSVLSSITDETIKGLLRTFGDAGTTPANATGKTVLKLLTELLAGQVTNGLVAPFRTPSGATLVFRYGTAVNATVILHTVTGGKTFYMTGYSSNFYNGSGAAAEGSLSVRDGGDTLQYVITNPYCASALEMVDSNSFAPAIAIPAGYDVTIATVVALVQQKASIWGFEL